MTGLGVDGGTGADFTVEGEAGTDFAVVVVVVELVTGFLVVGASVVVVSLSFDPNNPLKNPFFFVVASGADVVVVVVGASVVVVSLSFDPNNPLKKPFFFVVDSGATVVGVLGGKGLNSASA